VPTDTQKGGSSPRPSHRGRDEAGDGPWSQAEQAERYDEATNRLFYRNVVAILLRDAPVLAGVGLDLGCGSGFSLEVLRDAYPDMAWTGVDASRPMLTKARVNQGISDLPLVQADAARLPFAEKRFDVVVTSFAWHWFGAGAGDEVRRVLKPGGWLLAAVPLRQRSSAEGNLAVAKALLAGRRSYARRTSRGLRFADTASLLPGPARLARNEVVVLEEIFRDGAQMVERLASRGAAQAILGPSPLVALPGSDPVAYEWPFAVVHVARA